MNLDRLRALFVSEGRTRLAAIVEGLLRLEQGTADEEVMESLLRQTHSLKGSAAMVGMPEVGTVAHELEDLVEAVRMGQLGSGPDVVDWMLALADRIERLLDAGTEAEPDTEADPDTEAEPDTGAEPEGEAAVAPQPEPSAPTHSAAPTPASPHQAPAAPASPHQAPAPPPPHSVPAGIETAGTAAPEDPSLVRLPVSLDRLDDIVRLAGQVRSGLVRLRAQPGADAQSADARDTDVWGEDDLAVLRELEHTARQLQRTATAARTVPVAQIGPRLQRAVRDAARTRGVAAAWVLEGGEVELDRLVLERLEDALLHMVRNSIAHGLEPAADRERLGKDPTGTVTLRATSRGNAVRLSVADDGRGLDREALLAAARERGIEVSPEEGWTALVFRAGLSTATSLDELAGRGVGMDVVTSAVRQVGGSVAVDTTAGAGTTITLQVPLTLAVTRCLEVTAAGARYALPLVAVLMVLGEDARIDVAEDRPIVMVDGRSLPLLDLAVLLGAPGTPDGPIVVLDGGERPYGLRVATLVGQGEVTVQALGGGVPATAAVTGTSIASDGSALVVLDPSLLRDVTATARAVDPDLVAPPTTHQAGRSAAGRRPVEVLVVDDALTIRELQRSILERAGYHVRTAEDGREALALLSATPVDLVVTDVEMPRMDGYALTESIRRTDAIATTPVLILTTLGTDADRRRGLEAGADAYLLKSAFSAEALLAAVAAQVGTP